MPNKHARDEFFIYPCPECGADLCDEWDGEEEFIMCPECKKYVNTTLIVPEPEGM